VAIPRPLCINVSELENGGPPSFRLLVPGWTGLGQAGDHRSLPFCNTGYVRRSDMAVHRLTSTHKCRKVSHSTIYLQITGTDKLKLKNYIFSAAE